MYTKSIMNEKEISEPCKKEDVIRKEAKINNDPKQLQNDKTLGKEVGDQDEVKENQQHPLLVSKEMSKLYIYICIIKSYFIIFIIILYFDFTIIMKLYDYELYIYVWVYFRRKRHNNTT